MRFVRFSLDWASNGTYKFTEEVPFHPIKSTNRSSIEKTTTQETNCEKIYDLMGRSITHTNAHKGVYIVGGKKVVKE